VARRLDRDDPPDSSGSSSELAGRCHPRPFSGTSPPSGASASAASCNWTSLVRPRGVPALSPRPAGASVIPSSSPPRPLALGAVVERYQREFYHRLHNKGRRRQVVLRDLRAAYWFSILADGLASSPSSWRASRSSRKLRDPAPSGSSDLHQVVTLHPILSSPSRPPPAGEHVSGRSAARALHVVDDDGRHRVAPLALRLHSGLAVAAMLGVDAHGSRRRPGIRPAALRVGDVGFAIARSTDVFGAFFVGSTSRSERTLIWLASGSRRPGDGHLARHAAHLRPLLQHLLKSATRRGRRAALPETSHNIAFGSEREVPRASQLSSSPRATPTARSAASRARATAANAACPRGRHVRRGEVPAARGAIKRRRDLNELDLSPVHGRAGRGRGTVTPRRCSRRSSAPSPRPIPSGRSSRRATTT